MQPLKFWAEHGFCESSFSFTKDEDGVEAGVDEQSTKLAADDGVVASSTLEGISATLGDEDGASSLEMQSAIDVTVSTCCCCMSADTVMI